MLAGLMQIRSQEHGLVNRIAPNHRRWQDPLLWIILWMVTVWAFVIVATVAVAIVITTR